MSRADPLLQYMEIRKLGIDVSVPRYMYRKCKIASPVVMYREAFWLQAQKATLYPLHQPMKDGFKYVLEVTKVRRVVFTILNNLSSTVVMCA